MKAQIASELQQTVTEQAAKSSNEQLTKEQIAGEQEQTFTEQAAKSRSRRPSGSGSRPPRGSRSRSPPVPKRASPAEVPTVPDVIRPDVSPQARVPQPPQRSMLGGSWIDWDAMDRGTQTRRVAVLRNILNDPRTYDSYKMLCVGEKMENFENEDELLSRLQYLETRDLPPPGTPEEHDRKIQVAMLFDQALMMRTLLYHAVGS